MSIPVHLEQAVARMKDASWRIDQAKDQPFSDKMVQEWLNAVTDFTTALSDVQRFNNESIHEKLHDLAGRLDRLSRVR